MTDADARRDFVPTSAARATFRAITALATIAGSAALAIGAAFATSDAHAQTFPTRPVRLIVPWPVGTPADVAGRIVAERMGAGLGQPIVVENKPGAAGTIGMTEALRQPADGHTIYMLASSTLVVPLLFPSHPADFLKSLQPIGLVAWSYNVLVTPMSSPIASPRDLTEAAKAKPDTLTFASGGNGTPAHLAGELFRQQTGAPVVHIPYNQFPMAVGDLLAGRVNFMFLTASAAIPQIAGGKLRPMAVTGAQRLPALPSVPTMAEQGFADFVLRTFDGMTVRAGTPAAIVERLNAELNRTLAMPEVRERLGVLALEAQPMSPAAFGEVIASESDTWLRIGRHAGIKAD